MYTFKKIYLKHIVKSINDNKTMHTQKIVKKENHMLLTLLLLNNHNYTFLKI